MFNIKLRTAMTIMMVAQSEQGRMDDCDAVAAGS